MSGTGRLRRTLLSGLATVLLGCGDAGSVATSDAPAGTGGRGGGDDGAVKDVHPSPQDGSDAETDGHAPDLRVGGPDGIDGAGDGAIDDVSIAVPGGGDGGSADEAAGEVARVEAGSLPASDGGVVRQPRNHRPVGAACPRERPSGPRMDACWPDGGIPESPGYGHCYQDAHCPAGANARCSFVDCEHMGWCTFDECFIDSDCPDYSTCQCGALATDAVGNACGAAGNCRVDGDCGPDGYCSQNPSCGALPLGYFCHTPNDTCVDDSDCGPQNSICILPVPPGYIGCTRETHCRFDAGSNGWTCQFCPQPMPP